MAYEKNTWASGDVVTSAKLNHMENGIEAASSSSDPWAEYDLVCSIDDDDSSADWVVIKGDFETTKTKLMAGEPCRGLVNFLSATSYCVYNYPIFKFEYSVINDDILMVFKNMNRDEDWIIIWLNDGTVVWGD